jgi:hypothetical protein
MSNTHVFTPDVTTTVHHPSSSIIIILIVTITTHPPPHTHTQRGTQPSILLPQKATNGARTFAIRFFIHSPNKRQASTNPPAALAVCAR